MFRILNVMPDSLQRLQNPTVVIERGRVTNTVYVDGVALNVPPAAYRIAAVHSNNLNRRNG